MRPAAGALGLLLLTSACATDRQAVLAEPARTAADTSCPAPPQTPLPSIALRPLDPKFEGRVLLPPATPGEVEVELNGCAGAAPTEAEGTRHAAPLPSRGAQPPEVRLTTLRTGVIATHDLSHPCCLRAQLSARVSGATVTVLETLAGKPCRCECRSTLRTAVGLAPGAYTLELRLTAPGVPDHAVFQGPVTVPAH